MTDEQRGMVVETPKGRLIIASLDTKDVFRDERGREGVPSYKVEMAFEDDDELGYLEEAIVQAAIDEWGAKAEEDYEEGKIRSPLLDGNQLADAREQKGKSGDAYRGKVVLRASTIFNAQGNDAPGGVGVVNADNQEVPFAERGKYVYSGCYGRLAVRFKAYPGVGGGQPGVKAYLNSSPAFQFEEDGEPLVQQVNPFQTRKPSSETEGKGRRRRR